MDWNELSRWGWLLALMANLFIAWVSWSLKKRFVTHDDCALCRAGIEQRQATFKGALQDVASRQAALESLLENLPTSRDMQSISLSLSELRGDMKAQMALMTRLEKAVDLLQETHMERHP